MELKDNNVIQSKQATCLATTNSQAVPVHLRIEQAKLTASDKAASNEFGFSVSISADGNTCAVGAYLAAGAVYIFTCSGSTWTEQAKLSASDKAPGDNFRWSVSLSIIRVF